MSAALALTSNGLHYSVLRNSRFEGKPCLREQTPCFLPPDVLPSNKYLRGMYILGPTSQHPLYPCIDFRLLFLLCLTKGKKGKEKPKPAPPPPKLSDFSILNFSPGGRVRCQNFFRMKRR